MASPEWPGALVDAAPAAEPRRRRLTPSPDVVRFVLAIAAAAIVSTLLLMVFLAQAWRPATPYVSVELGAAAVFARSACVAWIPFSTCLYLLSRASAPPVAASLGAGGVTGIVLLICLLAQLDPTFAGLIFGDGIEWPDAMTMLPAATLIAIMTGAVGGLAFWAVALRRRSYSCGSAELVDGAGRIAFAYLAFGIALPIPLVALVVGYAGGHRSAITGFYAGLRDFALCAPVAWLPLFLSLCFALKARVAPILACLAAGTLAGSVLTIRIANYDMWFGIQLVVPRGDDSYTWLDVAEHVPELLTIYAPGGALGGFAFWAIRRLLSQRSRPATSLAGA